MSATAPQKRLHWWTLLPLLMFLMLARFLSYALFDEHDGKTIPSPFVGKPLPRIQAPDLLSGQAFDSKALLGEAFIVNVWATWCIECAREHPVFNRYAKSPGALKIIGLNTKEESDKEPKQWLERLGNPYAAIPVDADGRIAIDLGVYGAPETYFVDKQGLVRIKHIGPLTDAQLATHVESLR
jgi:cytochrome c biogenesis protein CcmG, thiol:disulfide interchange protein DsbE